MTKQEAIDYMYNETLKIERSHITDLFNTRDKKLKKEVVDEILSKLSKLEIENEN